MKEKLQDIAPYGQVWVCGACGKYNSNRYNVGDVSCFVNAVLCYDDETLKIKDGRVVSARAVKECKMKLRNKKTREIKEITVDGFPVSGETRMWECSEMDANEETGYKILGTYTSLAELNSEWEDAPEEPKGYWYIRDGGNIDHNLYGKSIINRHKEIGNYFNTREEAEKAVEKLKAWERLKDKGFHFLGWNSTYKDDSADFYIDWIEADSKDEIVKDLNLLFGGEE